MWELLKSQDKQRVFDASVAGMRKQAWEQSTDGAACAYRAVGFEGGCGIGCFLTEEEKDAITRNGFNKGSIVSVWCNLINTEPLAVQEEVEKGWLTFLQQIQSCHDLPFLKSGRVTHYKELAHMHGLTYPADPNGEDNV